MLRSTSLLAIAAAAYVALSSSSSHATEPNRRLYATPTTHISQPLTPTLVASSGLENIADASRAFRYVQLSPQSQELCEAFRDGNIYYVNLDKTCQQRFGLQTHSYIIDNNKVEVTLFLHPKFPDRELMHAYFIRNGSIEEIRIRQKKVLQLSDEDMENFELTGDVYYDFAVGYSPSKIVASVNHIEPGIGGSLQIPLNFHFQGLEGQLESSDVYSDPFSFDDLFPDYDRIKNDPIQLTIHILAILQILTPNHVNDTLTDRDGNTLYSHIYDGDGNGNPELIISYTAEEFEKFDDPENQLVHVWTKNAKLFSALIKPGGDETSNMRNGDDRLLVINDITGPAFRPYPPGENI